MKKKYEKPVIKKVNLVPSEAVLAACKSETTTGPAVGLCIQPNNGGCAEIGS